MSLSGFLEVGFFGALVEPRRFLFLIWSLLLLPPGPFPRDLFPFFSLFISACNVRNFSRLHQGHFTCLSGEVICTSLRHSSWGCLTPGYFLPQNNLAFSSYKPQILSQSRPCNPWIGSLASSGWFCLFISVCWLIILHRYWISICRDKLLVGIDPSLSVWSLLMPIWRLYPGGSPTLWSLVGDFLNQGHWWCTGHPIPEFSFSLPSKLMTSGTNTVVRRPRLIGYIHQDMFLLVPELAPIRFPRGSLSMIWILQVILGHQGWIGYRSRAHPIRTPGLFPWEP